MKIEDRRKGDERLFCTVSPGTCFEYNKKIYLKIIDCLDTNAFEIENGNKMHFMKDDIVIQVNAKVVIE